MTAFASGRCPGSPLLLSKWRSVFVGLSSVVATKPAVGVPFGLLAGCAGPCLTLGKRRGGLAKPSFPRRFCRESREKVSEIMDARQNHSGMTSRSCERINFNFTGLGHKKLKHCQPIIDIQNSRGKPAIPFGRFPFDSGISLALQGDNPVFYRK